MEGPLSKWTNVMQGWQYRWFVLDSCTGLLSYYTSKEKMMRGSRRGCVRLKGAILGIDDEDDSTFTITVDHKMFHFQARDAEEREKWVQALEDAILRHQQMLHNRVSMHFNITDFEKKMQETDSYLQILIDQQAELENKISQCDDEKIREQCVQIKQTSAAMIESVKHSIVLLQIAKNTSCVNGNSEIEPLILTPQPVENYKSNNTFDSPKQSTVSVEQGTECSEVDLPSRRKSEKDTHTVEDAPNEIWRPDNFGLENVLDDNIIVRPDTQQSPRGLSFLVPETSYSSSDDEFYEALENDDTKAVAHEYDPSSPAGLEDTYNSIRALPDSEIPAEENSIDKIYDSEDEDDLDSMEDHGSVITHLLSQVRLGMDLTKVVLPTFILEKRSLLEMYADFFAHPDLFVQIADEETPEKRMVATVRWYMSAFHAGRRGTVAKKPYNPILGEIFQCYWELPDGGSGNLEECSVKDGPLPWASSNNVTFISEQVSHHPPISAFYAEHPGKRITADAHIWTKSKFLGLSIGVHMIGQGCISLLDHDEEYIAMFPNGYGRSILTVPWVELGGKVQISCAKTGYYATIEFLTKPFYGGKKHQVTAEIFGPNDRKAFLQIEGEWNGVMYCKNVEGKNEVFVDTKETPVIKKKVLPVSEQKENESRALWQHVTTALKDKDVERATFHKHQLEQKQREEAKERKESGTKWQTKLFHENGEHWIYDRPLQKRISDQQ